MDIYIPDYLKEPMEKRNRLWAKILSCKDEEEKAKLGKEIQRISEQIIKLKEEEEQIQNSKKGQ